MKAEILLASGMHKLHWYVAPLPSLLVLLMGKKEIKGKKKKKIGIQSWYFFPQKHSLKSNLYMLAFWFI